MVMLRPNEWTHAQLHDPNSFAEWGASWIVFKVAATMLPLATPGALNAYSSSIRFLTSQFPQDWGSIFKFDMKARKHHWVRLTERIAQGTHNPNNSPDVAYDKNVPWDYVLQVTRHGLVSGPIAEWWSHKIDQLRHSPKPINKTRRHFLT